MWIRSDGVGEPQRLWESKTFLATWSFSPDGRRLAFQETSAETRKTDLWTLPLDTSDPDHPRPGKPELFLRTSASEVAPVFSRDGRWIAYASSQSGSDEIYVRPFAGGGKWQVSIAGGLNPIWSPAGRQLLYQTRDGRIFVADYTVEGNSFRPGKTRPWADKLIVNTNLVGGNTFDITPDGKRLVVLSNPERTNEAQGNLHVTVLVNFFDELRRRVPPDGK